MPPGSLAYASIRFYDLTSLDYASTPSGLIIKNLEYSKGM